MTRVWIVDDDEGILEAARLLLEDFGYSVLTFPGEDDLFSALSQQKPDVLLLDVLLSGSDGREIAQRMKSNEFLCCIPIIMMSADHRALATCNENGANACVKKPFDVFELDTLIRNMIQSNGRPT